MKLFKTKKMIFAVVAATVIIAGTFQSCNSEMDSMLGLEKRKT